ncbi:hypothetical protein SRHO_G00000270 [Serrasalmus rhombeus]
MRADGSGLVARGVKRAAPSSSRCSRPWSALRSPSPLRSHRLEPSTHLIYSPPVFRQTTPAELRLAGSSPPDEQDSGNRRPIRAQGAGFPEYRWENKTRLDSASGFPRSWSVRSGAPPPPPPPPPLRATEAAAPRGAADGMQPWPALRARAPGPVRF